MEKERVGNRKIGDGIGTTKGWGKVGGKGREREDWKGRGRGRGWEGELAYPNVKL